MALETNLAIIKQIARSIAHWRMDCALETHPHSSSERYKLTLVKYINNIPKNCCNGANVGIPARSLCPILGRVPRVDNGERVSKYSNLTAAAPAMTRRRGRFPQTRSTKQPRVGAA